MASQPYQKILQEALELTPHQIQLLVSDLTQALEHPKKRSMREFYGILGDSKEDAQARVNRLRQEWDDRERR